MSALPPRKSFGRTIAEKRKTLQLSQKELARRIKKEDGVPITPQYLNDIEHDRRMPSSDHMVSQFADALELSRDYLSYLVGRIPMSDLRGGVGAEKVDQAFALFRRALDT